jgi:Ca2+-transporting ATPase
VLAALGGDAARGLSDGEAAARLRRHGPNELPEPPAVPAWRRLLAQLGDVLTLLLLAATAVSAAAWWMERETPLPYEALTIVAIVLLNALLGFAQERRAERAVAALRALAAPTARVRRGGEPRQLPSAALVPGDLLLLEEGDTVPADARVLEPVALRTAEAALTGESAPVSKEAGALGGEAALADRRNMVYAGTAVAAGRGRAVVTATGPATELGRIAGALRSAPEVATPLQRELDRVGRLLGAAVLAVAGLVAATIVLVEELRTPGELIDVLLLAVSLAVAAVPEGLTAITTIVLSLGTQRLARRHVIVRRLSAVEALGSTTVICADKTGTLTRNEMTVRELVTPGGRIELTGAGYDPAGELRHGGAPLADPALRLEVEAALLAGALANDAALVERPGRLAVLGDPTEGALLVAARKAGVGGAALLESGPRVGEVPFSSERKLMSTLHAGPPGSGRLVLFAKGAPDVVLARCTEELAGGAARPLTPARRRAIAAEVERLGAAALRPIGLARRELPPGAAPGEAAEQGLRWLGVAALIDPPRPEARAAVAAARGAGIRPLLITGDHPATAAAIAVELGIAAPGEAAVTGSALERLDGAGLRQVVRRCAVFARVSPEHKLRIVEALHAEGAVVAMTGDGVNDAPALQAADIGVAMGLGGTDVARGAADLILTDDDFASIVAAVEEGRAIFADVQRFLRYLLSSNIGEVLVMFLGVVLAGSLGLARDGGGLVAPLLATQILWVNLLTDSGPALALGVEPPDRGLMSRRPRDPRRPVLGARAWADLVFTGAVVAAATLGVLDWALPGGLVTGAAAGGLRHARTMAFTTLVLAQLFNAFAARSEDESAFHRPFANGWLWLAVAASAALQVAVVHLPVLQRAFQTEPLGAGDWLACAAAGSAVLWATEALKLARRWRRGAPPLGR